MKQEKAKKNPFIITNNALVVILTNNEADDVTDCEQCMLRNC